MSVSGPVDKAASRTRVLLKLGLLAAFLILLNYGTGWIAAAVEFQFHPRHEQVAHRLLLLMAGLYVLLMVIPFMPAIELGLALMVVLGPESVLFVYLCTVIALSLSYLLGRLIPVRFLVAFLGWFHLERARSLVFRLEPLDRSQRMEFLLSHAPSKLVPFLIKHRYLLVALVLNLPGNALIGGGGGIGLIAGMSGLYAFGWYLLLISAAILPVPLLMLSGIVP